MALFLLEAAVGIHGSSNFYRHILPSVLESGTSDRNLHSLALSTVYWDKLLHSSQPQAQVVTTPQASVRNGAVAGQPWNLAVAVSSCRHPATYGTYLHCANGEEAADNVHSEALGLGPLMVPWASLVAEMATGEPKIPSLTF